MEVPFRPESAAPLVDSILSRGLSCAVLLRGDCGLHSLARGLQALLPAGSCRRVPGLSSVQAACAVFDLEWEGARILSAHGRDPRDVSPADLEAPLLMILGGGPGFGQILSELRCKAGDGTIHLASDLTLPGQTLSTVEAGGEIPRNLPSRTIALFRKVAS